MSVLLELCFQVRSAFYSRLSCPRMNICDPAQGASWVGVVPVRKKRCFMGTPAVVQPKCQLRVVRSMAAGGPQNGLPVRTTHLLVRTSKVGLTLQCAKTAAALPF
jgi:hypothetical protein